MSTSTRLSAGRVRAVYDFIEISNSVQTMCRLLDVAPSGYYAWLKEPLSTHAQEDARLLRLIRAPFVASQGIYGAPRAFLDLREGGETCRWYAANCIVQLLTTESLNQRLREQCCAIARARYSLARYSEALDDAVRDAATAAEHPSEPIRASDFAKEFWAANMVEPQGLSLGSFGRRLYRQGPESLRLYRELITPFAGAPVARVLSDAECTWCLAAPLVIGEHGTLLVNDPMYPFELPVPTHLLDEVRSLVIRFTCRPVFMHEAIETATAVATEAFDWMQERGLVIRTCRGRLDMSRAPSVVGTPAFAMRQVDADTDIVWFSRSVT